MSQYNATNERIKHEYFAYLMHSEGYSDTSVDAVAAALAQFEAYTRHKDFKSFRQEQAVGFKQSLLEKDRKATGRVLSKATAHGYLSHLRRFFDWLAKKPSYRAKIDPTHADYFKLTKKDATVASTRRTRTPPELGQIKQVIAAMPTGTAIERRDRALIAFTLLTGARHKAIATARIKHLDLDNECYFQDARQVDTKFSKTFTTYFFPVGDDIRQIVAEWVDYLKSQMDWGDEDPIFPATKMALNENNQFHAAGLERRPWDSEGPICKIFKEAFTSAGLPYFNPHSFRKTLVKLGMERCSSPEEFKAWSQNFGHEEVMTTFRSYGEVSEARQSTIFKGLKARPLDRPKPSTGALVDLADMLAQRLREMQA